MPYCIEHRTGPILFCVVFSVCQLRTTAHPAIDLDTDLSRTLKVKLIMPSDPRPTKFLIMFYSNDSVISHRNRVFQQMTLIWPFKVTKGNLGSSLETTDFPTNSSGQVINAYVTMSLFTKQRKLVPAGLIAGWGETPCESTPCSLPQESILRLYCKAVCNLEICWEKKQRHSYHCATTVTRNVISHFLLNSPNETNIGIDNESSVFMFRLRKFALPPGVVSAIFWQLAKMLSTISSFVCTHLATVTWLQIQILIYDTFNIFDNCCWNFLSSLFLSGFLVQDTELIYQPFQAPQKLIFKLTSLLSPHLSLIEFTQEIVKLSLFSWIHSYLTMGFKYQNVYTMLDLVHQEYNDLYEVQYRIL